MEEQKRCRDLVREHYRSRMADISDMRLVYQGRKSAHGETTEDSWPEFGLSLDYVAPLTFKGQKTGYLRFQISWGGPSDEFRFYLNDTDRAYRIEYWYLDWFDGAKVTVKEGSNNWIILADILEEWRDCEVIAHAREEATA